MIEINQMRVRLTFREEVLGMMPASAEVYSEYIAKNAPDAKTREEEIEEFGVDGVVEKSLTVFPRTEDGRPHLFDYQIRGMFKDNCGGLARVKSTKSSTLKAYKKVIDQTIFVAERKIPLILPEGAEIGVCQRPLRAQTAQGERIALAASETVPAGSMIEFTIEYYDPKHQELILEWLEHGYRHGLGQWRNSGKGSFTYEVISD
ncbi:hypothetical protein LJC64_04950 [Ruminococcaceae bacterium OttesenSCG-928-A11]|nr:hypothetical protein [Ruminococcaceae bacterium OttesenSCG-928-A11]